MKLLVINYSQSGQLDEIVTNLIGGIENCQIDRIKIQPKKSFAFPWPTDNFYDIMPETVLEEAIELEPIKFQEDEYDLIILGYQPWFLSPSMPTTALLQYPDFLKRLKNTPVITVIGARNMWLNAQISVVERVAKAGGEMVGNIALVDRAPNHLSAVSIAHWMMTGKKTRKWGIFPLPGISDKDIASMKEVGEMVNAFIQKKDFSSLQREIIKQKITRINTNILFIEGKAKKIFNIWARIIKKKEKQGKKRSFWISFFRFYLNFALFFVAPILLLIDIIFVRPFSQKKIREKKHFFLFLGMRKKIRNNK